MPWGAHFGGYSHYTVQMAVFGAVVTVIASKAYMLPFAFYKTVGVINYVNIIACRSLQRLGTTGARTAGAHKVGTIKTTSSYDIVIRLETASGRTIEKSFPWDNSNYALKEGLKISFTPLDDYPTILWEES